MVDVRFREVVIDCADPPTLARWWSGFTGYELRTDREDWATIANEDESMIIGFQQVPEGKVVKNRGAPRLLGGRRGGDRSRARRDGRDPPVGE
jgi:hypothetical protein